MKVLIADDDRMIRAYLGDVLREAGCAVVEASDGQAAVALGAPRAVVLGAVALGILAALGGAAALARRLTVPVRASIEGALQIARGNFGTQVPVEGKHELSDLAHTFNFMSGELSRYDGE